MALIPNELNKFRSYNYRWSLAALRDSQVNNPESYLSRDLDLLIIKSGGLKDKPIRTEVEKRLGINVEYFIDNVNIENLISANPDSGVGPLTTIEFEVTEPHSIGMFFQSLYIAAKQAGFENHLYAPYLLTCDFIGHDDQGNVKSGIARRALAINIINVTFKVDTGGAVYSVQAIPYNHIALTDETQRIKTSVSIFGNTVLDILNNSETSLCAALNRQEQELVDKQEKRVGNRYKISFPIDLSLPKSSASPLFSYNQGYGSGQVDPGFAIRLQQSNPATATFDPNSSDIGNSIIVQNFTEFGNNKFAADDFTYDEENQLYTRGSLSINEVTREFTFSENTKIEKIIEEVILTSVWGQTMISSQPDSKGWKWWFRIDTKVNIIDTSEMLSTGKPAMEFEYIVIPYRIHKSKFEDPNVIQDFQPQIVDCKKAYYYSYTGQNTDILDFEFTINTGYFRPLANIETSTDTVTANVTTTPASPQRFNLASIPQVPQYASVVTPAGRKIVEITSSSGGAGVSTVSRTVAELFNKLVLNSDVENVALDLKIWGDPYFLASHDAGNYKAKSGQQYITSDGTYDYTRSEVDILLTFRTAVDYSADTSLMKLDPVNAFNGIYRVILVRNTFSRGQFIQELSLLRRPNQDISNVTASNALVSSFRTNSYNNVLNAVTAVGSTLSFRPFVKAAESTQTTTNLLSKFGENVPIEQLTSSLQQLTENVNNFLELGNQIKNSLNTLQQLPTEILQSVGNLDVLEQLKSALSPETPILVDIFSSTGSIQTGPTSTDISTPASKPLVRTTSNTATGNTGTGIR